MSDDPRRWPRVRAALAALWKKADFDAADAMFFAGLFVAGLGGATVSVRWTLVAIGAVLILKSAGGLRGILWPAARAGE